MKPSLVAIIIVAAAVVAYLIGQPTGSADSESVNAQLKASEGQPGPSNHRASSDNEPEPEPSASDVIAAELEPKPVDSESFDDPLKRDGKHDELPDLVDSIRLSKEARARGMEAVTNYRARIHSEPDKKSLILYRVVPGTRLSVLLKNNIWAETILPDNKSGYILRAQLDLNGMQKRPSRPGDRPEKAAAPTNGDRRPYTASRQPSSGLYSDTGDGHWIQEVADGGRLVLLEDDSLWSVDSGDEIDSSLWLSTSAILVRESSSSIGGYRLINTDDDESVGAKFLGFR